MMNILVKVKSGLITLSMAVITLAIAVKNGALLAFDYLYGMVKDNLIVSILIACGFCAFYANYLVTGGNAVEDGLNKIHSIKVPQGDSKVTP